MGGGWDQIQKINTFLGWRSVFNVVAVLVFCFFVFFPLVIWPVKYFLSWGDTFIYRGAMGTTALSGENSVGWTNLHPVWTMKEKQSLMTPSLFPPETVSTVSHLTQLSEKQFRLGSYYALPMNLTGMHTTCLCDSPCDSMCCDFNPIILNGLKSYRIASK